MRNNEDEFEHEGKVYVEVFTEHNNCTGCDLRGVPACKNVECCKFDRKDGRSVIFKEKV